MKKARFLKSAALSAALAMAGGMQAQAQISDNDNGSATLIAAVASSVAVVAGDGNYGRLTSHSASSIPISCGNNGASSVIGGSNTLIAGTCPSVTVTPSADLEVAYTATFGALNNGSDNLPGVRVAQIFSNTGARVTGNQDLTANTAATYYIGVILANVGAAASGTYTGTYTFTANIQ